jgi:hypothetical protein
VPSAGKLMASISLGSQGIIIDYLEQCHTINGTYYADELRRLRQTNVRKRRSTLNQGALHLHDNAPAHTSRLVKATVTDCAFEILPHPPYFFRTWPLLTSTCVRNLKPRFVVDGLEAMKVSWRWSMSSLRTKKESSILKG